MGGREFGGSVEFDPGGVDGAGEGGEAQGCGDAVVELSCVMVAC